MGYGDLLSKAFATAWKYKYLWILGFFVAGSSLPTFSRLDLGQIGRHRIEALSSPHALGLLLFIGVLVLFVILALIAINRICAGGLVANAARIEHGESHSLSTGWEAGLRYFWRLLGLLVCFICLFFGLVAIVAVFAVVAGIIGTPLLILSLIFLIPLLLCGFFILAIAGSYAERFIVLENQGVFAAIESGFRLFRQQPGKSTAMGFIALVVSLSLGVGAGITFLLMILPLIGVGMFNFLLALIPGLLIVLPLIILVNAYLGTYRSCLWTFFFMQLRTASAVSVPTLPPANPAAAAPPPDSPQFE